MNNTILGEYIRSGVNILKSVKQLTMQGIAPFIFVLYTGVYPGIVLGNLWIVLAIIMLITSFVLMVLIIILAHTVLTLKKRLIIHILIYFNWCFQLLMVQTQWYTAIYGFNIALLFLYIPVVIIPILLGYRNAKKIKNGFAVSYSISQNIQIGIGGMASGLIGIIIGKVFLQNVSQIMAINIVLICFSSVSALTSIGFLSIQRLYYLINAEKSDSF